MSVLFICSLLSGYLIVSSYLIQEKYVEVAVEEQKLALLCLRYLSFSCYDYDLSERELSDFVVEGYYAFQEYAALHWIDHLEMLNQSQDQSGNTEAKELALAVMQFSERHNNQQREIEESPGILTGYLSNDRLIDYLSPLLTETRQLRAEHESIAGLGALGEVVSRVRSNIEQFIDTAAPDEESIQDMKRYYGLNWYKCLNTPVSTSTKGFLAQDSVIATSTGTNDHIAVLRLDVLDSKLASFRRRN